MKILVIILVILLLLLQYRLWIGDGSLLEVHRLQSQVEEQQQKNEKLRERNRTLEADVKDLKKGIKAIEERARSELGMIHKDETFFQAIEEDKKSDLQK